jgi:hypothetical protein
MAISPIKDAPENEKPIVYKKGDNRIGRIHEVKTDRGTFRFKDNRKGE